MAKAKNVYKEDSVMIALLEKKGVDIKEFTQGELVEGTVVSVSSKQILVDVGAKSEGIITSDEFPQYDETYKNLKPGDTLLSSVVQPENEHGYLVLSLRRAEKDSKWRDMEDTLTSGAVLEVTVIEYNKGGLLVECFGLRGFVPLSHLDRVHFQNDIAKFSAGSEAELKSSLKVLSGKKLKVKIIELDKEKNRLVMSEKDALPTYSDTARQERLENVTEGDVLDGIVTGLMPFGIFVDLDGIEGLVHISEIAWEKVSNPGNYYSVGSPIEVKVLGVDDKSGKLALSVKRLSDNPWETVEDKYPEGTVVEGTVSKVVPFGAFVNLEKGLDGLVHISETDGPLNEGDSVKAVVTLVDAAKQKLALSIKRLTDGSNN